MMMMTTYSADYHPHVVKRRTATAGPRPDDHQPSSAKMNGMSTYKDSFRTWPLQRRQQFRLSDNLTLNAGKFHATTTSKDDYRPFVGIATRQPCKPAPAASVAEQTEHVPFTTTTNYRLQYVPPPAEALKRPMSAPQRISSSHRPQDSFQGTTEFSEKFKPWAVSTRQPHRCPTAGSSHVVPKGHLTSDTTTHDTYARPPGPPTQAWTSEREVHMGDHRGRQRERRTTGKTSTPLAKSSSSTTTTTTYRSQFTPKEAHLPVRLHPNHGSGSGSGGPAQTRGQRGVVLDECTPNLQGAPCPASYIQPPGFEDANMTIGGHRLYRTISPEEVAIAAVDREAVAGVDDTVPVSHLARNDQANTAGRKGVTFDGRGRGQH